MAAPWEQFESGDTATATAPAEDQGPWSDFEPGVAAPVQAPDHFLPESQLREGLGREGRPIPSTPEQLAMQNFEIGGRRMLRPPGPIEIIPGSGLTTEREGDNIFPRVQTPPEAGALEKIAAGVVNTAGGVGNFMLSPSGVATALVPEVAGAKLAGPILKGLFGGMMAKSAGEMAGKASVTGDVQDWTEAGLAGAGAGLVTLPGLLPPRPPPVEGPPVTGELLKMPEGSAVPPKVPFNLPDAARAPEPPVVPTGSEAPAPAPPGEAAKPRTLTPALLVDGKPVTGAGEHADIFKAEIAKADDPKVIDALFKAQGDDKLHVFVDENGAPLTRLEAAKAFKEITGKDVSDPKKGLQSQDLIEAGLQKPAAKAPAAPESVKGGAESGLSPEAQAKSRANNSLRKMAEANGVEFVEGDTAKTVLDKINAKSSQRPTAAPPAPPAEPIVPRGVPTPPPAVAPSPFKAGDQVDHQGQTKTIKRMSPDGKFAVIGNRAIPVSEIKPTAQSAPELMTPGEAAEKLHKSDSPVSARDVHKFTIQKAFEAQKPVNASAVDVYGLKPPSGYVLEGDRYVSKPAAPKRAYSGLAYRSPAQEFTDLIMQHGAEHGWIDYPDFIAPGATGPAMISHNTEMAKAFRRAFKQLGIETDRNTLKAKAQALPKLKTFLESHAKTVETPMEQIKDGAEFTIAGEKHKVKGTNPDTELVTITDGKTLKVPMGGSIKIDPGSLKNPAAPEKGMPPSQDLGAAVPAAFDKPESFVSNMFAAIDRDRVAMGKEPMGDTRPQTWDEDNQRALAQMNRDPNWIPDLLDRMEKQPRPLMSWENAGVVWHRANLKAEYNGALQRVARAFDDNRTEDLTAAKIDAAVFEDKLERLDRIVGRNGTGSEAGRSLNAQKMGAGDDFTLVEMTLQKRAAVGGRRLTPEETSSIQKDVDRLNSLNAALQKSLTDADARASSAEAARAIAELKTSLPSFDRRVLKAAENIVVKMEGRAVDASARLREKLMRMSAGVDPTILYDASVIGSARIARLGLDLAKFTDSMVRDFGEKIRPLIGDIWQKSNEMLDANLARVPEPIRRVVKKTGAQDVRKEVSAAVKSNVDSGDMSKVTWQVQKLARELVKSGITEREALIDAVHDALKDVIPGITRRGTMDAISGYGDFKRLSKDRISLTLRGMKGEMQQLAKLEDMAGGKPPLKTGIERREVTPEERRLIKEVNDAKNKFQVPIDNPETQLKSALDTLKATLKNRIADFEDRLARKDYAPRPRREVQLDTEATRLRAEAERIKKRWRESLLADRMKNRTIWEKALDWGTKFRRFTALSSPAVIPKLLGAAGWRAVSTLAEDVSGGVLGSTIYRPFSKRAPLEGAGGQLAATMRGFGAAFTQGLKDAAKVTKTGHSDIDVLYGKASESYTGESEMASVLLGLPGRLHGTIKAPVKRGAFEKANTRLEDWHERTVQRLGEWYAKQGFPVTSDALKYRIALDAYKAGNRSIFLQDNRVASGFNAALQALEKKGETGHPSPGGKVLATTARFMFPVTRVPTNIAAETLQYSTGFLTGNIRAINAIRKGLDTLTPDQADLIMRELKKGSIGLAALYLGYIGYQSVGGVYEQGKKRKPGDVKPDAARMFGVDIPGNLLHAPVLNTIQLGATVHRTAEDKLRRKDADVQGIPAGMLAASWGLAEEVPFIQGPSRLFQGLKSPYTRQQTVGSEVGSVAIPQAVAWLAQVLDQRRETPPANLYQRITGPPARLKPRNIGESLETRIPGLRQNVSVNPKAVAPATPAAAAPPWEQFR